MLPLAAMRSIPVTGIFARKRADVRWEEVLFHHHQQAHNGEQGAVESLSARGGVLARSSRNGDGVTGWY